MNKITTDEALWASDVLLSCLQEAGDDVEAGFAAAEYILGLQPMDAALAIRHAPKGGVIVGGIFFPGGEFIPDEAWAKATPEEKAKVDPQHVNKERKPAESSVGADHKVILPKGYDKARTLTASVLHNEVKEYAKLGMTPKEANSGDCSTVAREAVDNIRKHGGQAEYAIPKDNLSHIWVVSNGKHYDIESPDGVDSPDQLPFFRRNPLWLKSGWVQSEENPLTSNKSSKSLSIDAMLAHDIHNRRAQGILNRSLKAAKELTGAAKRELTDILKSGATGSATAILGFIDKYRLKLAQLLRATQLASLLEGAREASTKIPTLPNFPGAATPPPSLEPKEAIALVDKLEKLTGQKRAEAIYALPPEQQTYVQHAVAAKEASPPIVPPKFIPPTPSPEEPEAIHFPVIEEATKQLVEKNVMTRDKFDALDAASRAKAFTVANVSAEETLSKIRDSIAENVREGVDYETWKGKVLQDVDKGTFLSEGHQETVFRTAVQTQFSDGQETVLSHPLVRGGFPYRARDAIHDGRVRETHLALERLGIQGTNIYRADDPVWKLFRVPWDYNDRCSDTPMTVRQAAEAGIEEAQKWLETGVEPTPPAHVPMPDFRPPPGFQRALTSAPMSIQLSMQSIDLFLQEVGAEPKPNQKPSLLSEDEYPRDASNRFIDKYKIASASCNPELEAEVLESIPEEQRPKLLRAIQHLQSGGGIHHPKEPPGLAIDKSGWIFDPQWAEYERRVADHENWAERQLYRDNCRKLANQAVKGIRSDKPDLDEIDTALIEAGATDAEMRTVARIRYKVSKEQADHAALEEVYESVAEAVHRRIDQAYEMDPTVPMPQEPPGDSAALSVDTELEGKKRSDPNRAKERDKAERIALIAEILVSLFGEKGVDIAKQLKSGKQDISIPLAIDPNTGYWHGPTPPSSNWIQIGRGPHGGLIWAPAGHGVLTNVPAPAASSQAAPPPQSPQQPQQPPGPSKHAAAHRIRATHATAAYNYVMSVLTSGGTLTASEKVNLSKQLSVMSKPQLKTLYNMLGGTAVLQGAQRQPWVHAIKAILTGVPQPVATTQPKAAALAPKSTTGTAAAPSTPVQDEMHWETGKPQPGTLNGIDFAPAPPKFWEKVKDVDLNVPLPLPGKRVDRVGVLIQEPDGRIWIVKPTNEFGDRKYTIPGGSVEPGLTNQQNALKEVWEETGLQVEITGYAGDFEDSNNQNNGRLYIGKRVGGAPWDAKIESHIISYKTGKPSAESEVVSLVTLDRAAEMLNRTDDLGQLMVVRPIPLETPTRGKGSNPLKKLVDAVQPKAEDYKNRKIRAGESVGDATLHAIQEMRGYNKPPKVVSKADFDKLVAQGDHIEMLRGLQDHRGRTANDLADGFRQGEHYPGHGCFGSGTYADSTKGSNNAAVSNYGYGGAVLRIALPKTAKIIKQSELEKKVPQHPEAYSPGKTHHEWSHCWQGIQAALAGYDAIYVDGKSVPHGSYGRGFYVILNRGIVTVQDKNVQSGYTIK